MRILRLEELEPRQLLSRNFPSPGPSPAPYAPAENRGAQIVSPMPPAEAGGGPAAPPSPGGTGGGLPPAGPYGGRTAAGLGGCGPEPSRSHAPAWCAGPVQDVGINPAVRIGAADGGSPAADSAARPEAAAGRRVTGESPAGSEGAVVAAPTARAAVVSGVATASVGLGPEAAAGIVVAALPSVREGEGTGVAPVLPPRHPGLADLTLPAAPPADVPDGSPAETGPEPAPPPAAGVPAGPSAAGLPALEQAMRQFLKQLEEAGRELTGEQDGTGLFPWVVAGAAAVAACELARRQLGRPGAAGGRTSGVSQAPFLVG